MSIDISQNLSCLICRREADASDGFFVCLEHLDVVHIRLPVFYVTAVVAWKQLKIVTIVLMEEDLL